MHRLSQRIATASGRSLARSARGGVRRRAHRVLKEAGPESVPCLATPRRRQISDISYLNFIRYREVVLVAALPL